MGIIRNGLFGNYTGKLGNTVAYLLKGKSVIRIIGKNDHPPSAAQLLNRKKMAVVVKFLKPLTELLNIGFKALANEAGVYPFNLAVSYHKMNALTGTYPAIEMDYTKVLMARGSLLPAADASVTLVADGLRFNWNNTVDLAWPERTDNSILVAYFPELNKVVYNIGGAKRYIGQDRLDLDLELRMAYMEVYMAFMSIGSDGVSDSVYLGRLN